MKTTHIDHDMSVTKAAMGAIACSVAALLAIKLGYALCGIALIIIVGACVRHALRQNP